MAQYDVLLIGDYFVDLIFTGLPALPELGREIVATGFEMIPGGAYNTAVAMHRLGVKVGWPADFGDDDFSSFAMRRARAEGLDDALFVRHKRPLRRITVAASYPQDRAFITYSDPDPSFPAAMRALPMHSARVLLVAGLYFGSFFDVGLSLVRARGMKLVMDGNTSIGDPRQLNSSTAEGGGEAVSLANPAVHRAIQSLDLFTANVDEVRWLTGLQDLEAGMRALCELCPLVVIKAGAQGAYACDRGRVIHAPAIPVTPLDTTGAGDCFNAGFLKAWLDGRPLEECLRWANIVGGLSTLARGGTGYVVTPAEVEKWLGSA